MNDEKLVYEIVDDEHPENNVIVDPNAPPLEETPEQREARREEAFQRVAHLARLTLAQKIAERRAKERTRALKGRVAKRRRSERDAKESRKRNR